MPNSRLHQLMGFLAADPADPFLWYALALEHIKAGQLVQAAEAFECLVNNHPTYLATYYHYGKLLERQSDGDKAAGLYQTGIDLATKQRDHHARAELQEALAALRGEDSEDE